MSRDLRRYARQTNVRVFVGFLLILLFIGEGLIYAFYGAAAAVSGLLCILAGLFPLLLIWGFLNLLDWIAKRANEQ
jgi:hypothetical protein